MCPVHHRTTLTRVLKQQSIQQRPREWGGALVVMLSLLVGHSLYGRSNQLGSPRKMSVLSVEEPKVSWNGKPSWLLLRGGTK